MEANLRHQEITTEHGLEEFFRLPKPGKRIFGLSRSSLNELVLPCEANNFIPPVKSTVIKKRGAIRGIRLISRDSFMDYLRGSMEGGAR